MGTDDIPDTTPVTEPDHGPKRDKKPHPTATIPPMPLNTPIPTPPTPPEPFTFLLSAIAHDNPCDPPAYNITNITPNQLAKLLQTAPQTPNGTPILHNPNFTNTTFTGDANFNGATFTGEISFDSATFENLASFDSTTFENLASFDNTTFENWASFDNTTFENLTFFNNTTFESWTFFDGATFTDEANFNEATFENWANFNEATFENWASFKSSTFTNWANFNEATFTDEANFNEATFENWASFKSSTFTNWANFNGATFKGEASFDRATFTGHTNFDSTTFTNWASFDSTTFTGEASFDRATFEGDASFNGATFEGEASFDNTMFMWGVKLGGVTFEQSIESFSVFSWGRADFSGTQFMRGGALRFSGGETVLDGARFGAQKVLIEGDNDLWGAAEVFAALLVPLVSSHIPVLSRKKEKQGVPRLLSLRGVDASMLTLAGLDLSQCSFDKVHNLDGLRFEQGLVFCRPPKWFFQPKRRVLCQEALWRKQHSHFKKKWAPPPLPQNLHVPSSEPKDLAQIYRGLRKGREDAKNEPGAADFYYGEMEMRRRSDSWGTCRLLDAYWLVSGYGLRPLRSGAWLVAVVVMAIAVFSSWGLEDMEGSSSLLKFHDAVQFSLGALVSMSTVENTDLTRVGKWVRIALRFFGPVLLGLTVLAVRGRVKR